jgi:hypothetical protein
VPAVLDDLHRRVGYPLGVDVAVLDGHHAVVVGPQHERRRCDTVQPALELGVVEVRRPAVARQAGLVAVGGEDEVHVGLGREHAGRLLGVLEERRDELLGRHEEDVRGHVARDPQPGGTKQREPVDPLGRVDGELGRQPAAERPADDVDALEPEAVEDLEVVVDEIVHRLDLGHVVGAAEPGVVGRHHREAAGQQPEEGVPRARAAGRVEEEERGPLAAPLDVDRAAAELEPFAGALGRRAGRVGHVGQGTAVSIRVPNVCVRFLDMAVERRVRCAAACLRTCVRCANPCRS